MEGIPASRRETPALLFALVLSFAQRNSMRLVNMNGGDSSVSTGNSCTSLRSCAVICTTQFHAFGQHEWRGFQRLDGKLLHCTSLLCCHLHNAIPCVWST